MNKYKLPIMAIKREHLFENGDFSGFNKDVDYESRILSNYEFLVRENLEQNPEYKQPIAYTLVVNPNLKKIFAFQRSVKDNYTEKRLKGKWSWGVGGHIDPIDESSNPLHTSLLRELNEEIHVNEVSEPKLLGYINDDSNEVGKVHFGVLYVVETDSETILPKDGEIENGKFLSLEELENVIETEDVEDWSKISLEPLREYLAK